jgi:hypothetical protein
MHPQPITRRRLLGTTAVAGLAGAGLAAGITPTAAAADSVIVDGVKITKVKNLTGPDITGKFGLHWVDLGAVARCPDGRDLYVFGDSFGPAWGENWRSPTALWSNTRNLAAGVVFNGTPGGDWGKQLIPYEHGDEISTIIPSDVITIGRKMYLHAVVNQGFGNVIWSGIWVSEDNGENWEDSGARFPGPAYDKRWQLASWDIGRDGWLYVYTSEFLRESSMILHRVRPQHITNPDKYQPWGKKNGRWCWGAEPTPLSDRIIGENSLRRFGDRWLHTWFNGPNYRIDAQVLNHPTQDPNTAKTFTLLHGTSWDNQDVNHLAQLYGSYVIPGSRLSDVHLTVSQWNTGDNSVYHVMQYRFEGLDKFDWRP